MLEYALRQSYIFNLNRCWQEGKVLARQCFIMLLCIINNLARNPNKDEWPAEQSTHPGMALSSTTLYFSIFILNNILWTSAGIIIIIANIGLCSARGPFDVFILGGMLCVAKKTRSQPPASTSTNEPEIMHHELSTTSARAPDKSYQEISEGILAAARFKHVTCLDCEVNLYNEKTSNLWI